MIHIIILIALMSWMLQPLVMQTSDSQRQLAIPTQGLFLSITWECNSGALPHCVPAFNVCHQKYALFALGHYESPDSNLWNYAVLMDHLLALAISDVFFFS